MIRQFCSVLLFLLTCAEISRPASALEEPQFLAGAAVADVTPNEPVPMWGYGARHASLSEGTLDPLLATVLVLQTGWPLWDWIWGGLRRKSRCSEFARSCVSSTGLPTR